MNNVVLIASLLSVSFFLESSQGEELTSPMTQGFDQSVKITYCDTSELNDQGDLTGNFSQEILLDPKNVNSKIDAIQKKQKQYRIHMLTYMPKK